MDQLKRRYEDWRNTRILLIIGLILSMFAQTAMGAQPLWANSTYVSSAKNLPLPDLLRDFSANQGLRTSIDSMISGRVSLDFRGPPQVFVARLEADYGITWYYDGSALFFSRADSNLTETFRLDGRSFGTFEASLVRLGIADSRFKLRFDPATRVVVVSGPPRYVELVREAGQSIAGRRSGNEEEVRIFSLRYGWAQDRNVQVGTQTELVPGVATTLMSVFHGKSDSTDSSRAKRGPTTSSGVRDKEIGDDFEIPRAPDEVIGEFLSQNSLTRSKSRDTSEGLPQIYADVRLNAVIVRDFAYRMDSHERLIRALDVKPTMVELSFRTIDAESAALKELLPLLGASPIVNARAGSGPGRLGFPARGASPMPFAAVVPDAQGMIMKPMESLGEHVRVSAETKIIALDNIAAQLSNIRTLYIKGSEAFVRNTMTIEAGIRLQVISRVIRESDGTRQVQLSLTLRDGSLNERGPGEWPEVSDHALNTNAIVRAGESLLMGGLSYDFEAGAPPPDQRATPKGADGTVAPKRGRTERLYLITPRILED